MSSEAPSPIPQPEELGARERDDAMGAYLMMFAALHLGLPVPLLGLLASVIYHLVNARKSPFTRFHSLQSLISQIPVSVLTGIWTVWAVVVLIDWWSLRLHGSYEPFWWFTLFTAVCSITYSVYCIIAAVFAHKGRMYYFPLVGRWAYKRAFSPKAAAAVPRNVPPKGL